MKQDLRSLTFLGLLGILLACMPQQSVTAQSTQRCFVETRQCIAGSIRAYWERNGGLAIFGYPITEQRIELVEGRSLLVQWFERDRLEDHGAIGVLAGRLGAQYLEQSHRPWQVFPTVNPKDIDANCEYFGLTGHSMCEPFRSYWKTQGGLERFGYPITQPVYEQVEGRKYQVQYFERRRMEIHSELSGSPILLGLLGNEVRAMPAPLSIYPACLEQVVPALRDLAIGKPLGCPTLIPLTDLPASTQRFEHGLMLWTAIDSRRGRFTPGVSAIAAIIDAGRQLRWYEDTWVEGSDPDTPAVSPPAGLYAPWRGFGKAWSQDAVLRDALGWATEPIAQPAMVDLQVFEHGVLVIRIKESGIAYVFGNNNTPYDVQVIGP